MHTCNQPDSITDIVGVGYCEGNVMLFKVFLQLLPTDAGGKTKSAANTYSPMWSKEDRDPKDLVSGRVLLMRPGVLEPGEEALAIVVPLVPENWAEWVAGDMLYCYEGAHLVGRAVIECVYRKD